MSTMQKASIVVSSMMTNGADAVGVDIGGEIKAGLEHGEEGLRAEVAERAEEVARQVGGPTALA